MKKNKISNKNELFSHTYSIVARDSKTGQMGVGVQSHYFSVGRVVSWGVSEDEGRDVRQVAILDAQGRVAAHTGSKCIKHAGHIEGNNFSVQANMMLTDKVWSTMAKSFESNVNLPLAERIIKTMEAAETVGGDIRGKQSAAILIVGGKEAKNKWEDKIIDLRVEDNEQPVKELSRLLKLHRAYKHMDEGDLAIEHNDMEKALKEYDSALNLFPENLEMKFWTAISLANNQKLKEASELFKTIFIKDNNWRLLTERLPESGLLNLTKKRVRRHLIFIIKG